MSWVKDKTICSIEGCWNKVRSKGWCNKHYLKYYKKVDDYRPISIGENLRNHPFYLLWWDRKQAKVLCEEWLDFKRFIEDISPKPEGNYFLVRLRDAPYGPNNFKWQEHLKRKENETKKEWWARKWKARQIANPSMERERNFKRKYGITIEEYNKLLEKQNYVCEICKNKETSVDGKNGSKRKLAVDHCHNSNKIRGLLCWRCNSMIGRLNEDVTLLKKMIVYLEKHNGIS